jgi:hypothetical protein
MPVSLYRRRHHGARPASRREHRLCSRPEDLSNLCSCSTGVPTRPVLILRRRGHRWCGPRPSHHGPRGKRAAPGSTKKRRVSLSYAATDKGCGVSACRPRPPWKRVRTASRLAWARAVRKMVEAGGRSRRRGGRRRTGSREGAVGRVSVRRRRARRRSGSPALPALCYAAGRHRHPR